MTDLNREVGEIKAQVRYITQDVSEIKSDVKALLAFKWRVLGFSGFAAFIATAIIEIIRTQ